MTIEYDDALLAYMEQKGMTAIAVEVVTSNSDIEITELHVHLLQDRLVEYYKTKKGFRSVQGSAGEVLLPPYRLEYDETIRFYLKKLWIFRSVGQTGIRL